MPSTSLESFLQLDVRMHPQSVTATHAPLSS
jgi:hypothetical protein